MYFPVQVYKINNHIEDNNLPENVACLFLVSAEKMDKQASHKDFIEKIKKATELELLKNNKVNTNVAVIEIDKNVHIQQFINRKKTKYCISFGLSYKDIGMNFELAENDYATINQVQYVKTMELSKLISNDEQKKVLWSIIKKITE